MYPIFRLLSIVLFTTASFVLTAQKNSLNRRTKLPPSLKEVSGMTRLPNGDLWLLNDSHNPSDLFRFDPVKGILLETRRLPVANFDWEDLTCDPAGNLYIGDFGNNKNRRKNLRVFVYNPITQALDSIQFSYPDQTAFPPARETDWNFNCEAFVFFQDSLHLFSKNVFAGNFFTKHYVLPAKPGNYVAILCDSIQLKNRVVTGAALSKDGHTLALTGYIIGKRMGILPYTKASAMFFQDYKGSQFLKGKQRWKRLPKFLISRQFESITQWDEKRWLVANEGRKPQYQAIWRTKKKRK